MMKIEWDDELADIAQAHANQCKFEHDCNQCRQVNRFSVGQNLFSSMSSDPSPSANWTQATQSWYKEITNAPGALVQSFQSSSNPKIMWGHFTQVVWADTWKIGCGFTAYKSDRWAVEKLYTCNYGPAGNFEEDPMYKSGSPASQCPGNTVPARDYPALCEVADSTGPKDANEKKLRDTSLFYCDFSDGTDICGLKIRQNNNAYLVNNKLFQYLTFDMLPSQWVSFELPYPIKSSGPWCLSHETRKGASDAKDKAMKRVPADYHPGIGNAQRTFSTANLGNGFSK